MIPYSEARYRSLVDTTPDAIVTMDDAGILLFINPAGERMLGYSADELVGKPLSIIMPERYRERHRAGLARYLQTRERKLDWTLLRLPGLHKSGREIPLSISFGEYRDNDRSIFTGILRDITDLTRREAGMRFLLEASEVLASSLDYEATLKSVAELATRSIADWAVVDLLEGNELRRVAVAHPDPARLKLAKALEARYPANPGASTGAHQVVRKGERILASDIPDEALTAIASDEEHLRILRALELRSYICAPLKLRGEVIGAITFVSSEPTRRYNEEDADLAEELARRAAVAIDNARLLKAAEAARIAAEEANASKSQFLAMMSHELRTPLNAIGGYAELLAVGVRGELEPQQLSDVRRIQRSQAHLLSLINDVLNFAKLEAGQVRFHYIDAAVGPLLAALEDLVRPQLDEKNLKYTYGKGDNGVTACIDEEKFQQVMLNLLTNAIKYTEPGGEVRLDWEAESHDIVVRVRDTGRGIEAEKIDAIFEPFVQVGQRLSMDHGGVGLGLAISRDIARGMHGDITVESRVGEGSVFTLRVPRRRAGRTPD